MLVAHQNPTDLILAILCTDTQLPLTVLDQSTIQHHHLTVTFQIIGESHAVHIAHQEKLILQEILACIDIPANQATHHHAFNQLAPHDYNIPNYCTTISFDTHNIDDSIPLLSNPSLEVRFPAIYGHQPITQIEWNTTDHSINWKTLHLYPSEHDIISVKSVSKYELP